MALNKNATYLMKERHCRGNESPIQVFERVANTLSLGDGKLNKQLYDAMRHGVFLPSSSTLHNAGIEKTLLHPCHVIPVHDNIRSIMDCLSNCATIFHYGGGVGFNISELRPRGAKISSGGVSDGVVSFLSLFDKLVYIVKQGSYRLGAMIAILDCNHPEILSFVTSKLTGKLTNFNISILVTDEFMNKVTTDEEMELKFGGNIWNVIKAKDLFDQIVFSAYISGDPGLLFFDRINKDNKLYPNVVINACNPCGEVPLPPMTCCNLGAINLSKFVAKTGNFDMKKFSDVVRFGIKTLRNVNIVGWYPFPEMEKQMRLLNPCGLGFMGLADALIMMGIYYDSEEAIKFLDDISKPYVEITEEIAKDSFYKRSQQPTGSLSIIAGNVSPGIEPVFDRKYERHLTIGVMAEGKDLYKSKYCRTALEISPEWHLKIQAKIQSFVDSGVSKTVNLPEHASIDDIRNVYINAWKMGCKGVTVFRHNCKEGVLRRNKCDGAECIL